MIVALLTATGMHWLALQSAAWTAMLARNLQTASFAQALNRTFDGKHPCSLCKQISKDKQTEKKSELQTEQRKLEFTCDLEPVFFMPPMLSREVVPLEMSRTVPPLPPPVPPPKPILG